MFKNVSSDLNFIDREKEVLDFWKENDTLRKSLNNHQDGELYTFYDGPPTANGQPHIGHVFTRVIKDLLPRYHSLKGNKVFRKAGWDTHGLPVELEVEKLLGLDGKDQIEKYGVEPFIKKCRESVWKYKGMWEEFSDRVGFWTDMEHPYITYENNYIESEWWALKQIWEKGLLYQGFKIVPYCPRCGTPLSSHEVAQGYKDVKETSAIAKFKVKGQDEYILAWTTTPWTLASNVGLCVNPEVVYVKAKKDGTVYILAEALVESVLGEEAEVLEKMTGKDLEYTEYEPLYTFVQPDKKCWFVTCDNYVSTGDGTGVVHIAPAFGEDDARIGRNYDLPFVQLVDSKGEMTAETNWPGVFCKDADKLIFADLKERGLLFAALPFEHSYPFCWRCDTPLIYYARNSWFIKMSAVKDDLIKNNETINWYPPTIGKNRFGNWLENVQDWGISRDRYWGTPLNIWECECGHRHAVGSIEELKKLSPNCPDEIELHKPYVDDVTIACEKCGMQMKRVPEVIDCWFDSGAMPFAQYHYPFENQELFQQQFPADFISEALDQTRGWFYSLLAISTLLFDKAPFKNVIVMGLVQDENGQKMSKSKGNAVDPFEALNMYGADAVRWYFYSNSAPWLPNRFQPKVVLEGQRKMMGTFWNTYAFFILYANIDGFDPTQYKLEPEKLNIMDKWILSRTYSMVKAVDENLAGYKVTETANALDSYVDDLSNWYVRCNRKRFWVKGMPQDKINAYMTLYTALVLLTKAASPMLPFMAESVYQNLVRSVDANAPESVHLGDFPKVEETLIDSKLEEDMKLTMEIVSLGRAARNNSSLKNRQPLDKMYVKCDHALSDDYQQIIEGELNIKSVDFVQDVDAFNTYSFKPQLKTVGPKFGKDVGAISVALKDVDGDAVKRELDANGKFTLAIPGREVELETADLLIDTKSREHFAVVEDYGVLVAIDTTLTPQLVEEGLVREVVSKLQTMRKEADFNVTDHIFVYVSGNAKIEKVIEDNWQSISADVLGDALKLGEMDGFHKENNINGETVELGVQRV